VTPFILISIIQITDTRSLSTQSKVSVWAFNSVHIHRLTSTNSLVCLRISLVVPQHCILCLGHKHEIYKRCLKFRKDPQTVFYADCI